VDDVFDKRKLPLLKSDGGVEPLYGFDGTAPPVAIGIMLLVTSKGFDENN